MAKCKIDSSLKNKFRRGKPWLNFRSDKRKEQKIDPITLKPLTKKANCHHMDLDSEHYFDLSDSNKYLMLNNGTHTIVHKCYEYYRKDKDFIRRLESVLEEMYLINNGQSFR